MITFFYIKAVFALSHRWISLFSWDSVVNMMFPYTKTSCCFKALEKCWNSFNVSRYALVSGHPGGGGEGWPQGDPGNLHNDVYKYPLPKNKIV